MNFLKYSFIFSSIFFAKFCFAIDAPFPDNTPLMLYSSNHQYYVVSVPKKFNGMERYAAVFSTKTKELVFKVDSLYTWDLKVSNDGKFLYALTFEMDSNTQNWYVEQYTASSKSEKHFIHKEELIQIDNGNYLFSNLSWNLYDHRIEMIGNQKTTMLLNNFSVETTELAPDDKNRSAIMEVDWKPDLLFELDSLKKPNAASFSTDLIRYLGYKSGYDRKMTVRNVFIRFIMLEDGTFSDLSVFAQNGKMAPEKIGELDKELIERIEKYILKYKFSKETVPNGVPYWYYSGTLLLVK